MSDRIDFKNRSQEQMIEYGVRMRKRAEAAERTLARVEHAIEAEWLRMPDGHPAVPVHRLKVALGDG